MAGERTLPGIGLTGFWDLGDDTYKPAMDANWRALSILVQARALDLVNADPGAPAQGDVYLFGATHPTHANKLAAYDDGAWFYLDPLEGWLIYNIAADSLYEFDGAAWVVFSAGGGGGGASAFTDLTDAPADYSGAGGKAVFVKATEDGLEFLDASAGGLIIEPHRYWRLFISTTFNDGFTGLSELQFRGEVGGANLVIGQGTPIAFAGSAAAAFDGNFSTYWSTSGSTNRWIGYDFGPGNEVGVAEILVGAPEFLNQALKTFKVEYSDDGATWLTAWTMSTPEPAWSGGEQRTYENLSPTLVAPSTGDPPFVVQQKTVANNAGAVVLDAAPTPGNLLVAVCAAWQGSTVENAATGWKSFLNTGNSNTNDVQRIAGKVVVSGTTVNLTPFLNIASGCAITVFEVSGVTSFDLYNCASPAEANVAAQTMRMAALAKDSLLVGMTTTTGTALTPTITGAIAGASVSGVTTNGTPHIGTPFSKTLTAKGAVDVVSTFTGAVWQLNFGVILRGT